MCSNFENTYFELLAVNGSGIGADLVNHTINEKGEGLLGLVLGTKNIVQFTRNVEIVFHFCFQSDLLRKEWLVIQPAT